MAKLDISKVKKEIDDRKSQMTERSRILGENTVVPSSGNQFLRELKYSRESGVKTGASVKVAAVAKVADAKANKIPVNAEAVTKDLMEHVNATNTPKFTPKTAQARPTVESNKMDESKRIAELASQMEEQERRKGQTLADALSQYVSTPHVGTPMSGGYLTEAQLREAMIAKNTQMGGMGVTPNMIVEQVSNVAEQYLQENFGSLFSEAMKQTIVETYKAERVKAAIQENRELIKDIVVETILELQKRNQSKKT